jgi:hypothetical protein
VKTCCVLLKVFEPPAIPLVFRLWCCLPNADVPSFGPIVVPFVVILTLETSSLLVTMVFPLRVSDCVRLIVPESVFVFRGSIPQNLSLALVPLAFLVGESLDLGLDELELLHESSLVAAKLCDCFAEFVNL